MSEVTFEIKDLPELIQEYKTLEQLFLKSIEQYKSYEEVHPLFSRMREIRQQIISFQEQLNTMSGEITEN